MFYTRNMATAVPNHGKLALEVPAQPVACSCGLFSTSSEPVGGKVACCFVQLGFPGKDYNRAQ